MPLNNRKDYKTVTHTGISGVIIESKNSACQSITSVSHPKKKKRGYTVSPETVSKQKAWRQALLTPGFEPQPYRVALAALEPVVLRVNDPHLVGQI